MTDRHGHTRAHATTWSLVYMHVRASVLWCCSRSSLTSKHSRRAAPRRSAHSAASVLSALLWVARCGTGPVGQVGILEDCPLDAAPFDDVDTIKMDEFLNWRVPLNSNAINE